MAWELENNILFNMGNCSFDIGGDTAYRRRPLGAVSLIRIRRTSRVKAANLPSALVKSFHSNESDLRPIDTEGAHLIGIQLGGADISENIVPMYSHVNRGTFAAVEQQIASSYGEGRGLGLVVELTYMGADPRIPSQILVRFVSGLVINENTLTYAFVNEIQHWTLGNAPDVVSRIDIDPATLLKLQTAQAKIDEGWTIEHKSPLAQQWAGHGWIPPIATRRYALLDYLTLEDDPFAADIGVISPGRVFSAKQRQLIQLVNRYMQPDAQRGECWSDVADDPIKQALLGLGADTGIEIDHIIPKASSGPNVFSNAQVASSAYNRSKGRMG